MRCSVPPPDSQQEKHALLRKFCCCCRCHRLFPCTALGHQQAERPLRGCQGAQQTGQAQRAPGGHQQGGGGLAPSAGLKVRGQAGGTLRGALLLAHGTVRHACAIGQGCGLCKCTAVFCNGHDTVRHVCAWQGAWTARVQSHADCQRRPVPHPSTPWPLCSKQQFFLAYGPSEPSTHTTACAAKSKYSAALSVKPAAHLLWEALCSTEFAGINASIAVVPGTRYAAARIRMRSTPTL